MLALLKKARCYEMYALLGSNFTELRGVQTQQKQLTDLPFLSSVGELLCNITSPAAAADGWMDGGGAAPAAGLCHQSLKRNAES